jgi:hypothetical protein
MKMTKYQIFLLSFATVSWVFLSGLNMAVDNDRLVLENQKTSKEAETHVTDNNKPIKRDELEKPLDLSVPEKNFENADRLMEQRPATQSLDTPIFAPETQKKARPIELNGNFLMSPEPEAEKLKSVDGAGIVIKLKR